MTRDITTGDIETVGQMWKGETVVYGNDVRHAIAGVHNDTSGETLQGSMRLRILESRGDLPCAYNVSTAWMAT